MNNEEEFEVYYIFTASVATLSALASILVIIFTRKLSTSMTMTCLFHQAVADLISVSSLELQTAQDLPQGICIVANFGAYAGRNLSVIWACNIAIGVYSGLIGQGIFSQSNYWKILVTSYSLGFGWAISTILVYFFTSEINCSQILFTANPVTGYHFFLVYGVVFGGVLLLFYCYFRVGCGAAKKYKINPTNLYVIPSAFMLLWVITFSANIMEMINGEWVTVIINLFHEIMLRIFGIANLIIYGTQIANYHINTDMSMSLLRIKESISFQVERSITDEEVLSELNMAARL